MSIANISQTKSREEQMDYSEPPYFWTGKIFYAKKGKIKSIKDLGGKKIGVDQGSNAFTAAPQEIAKFTDKKPEMLSFQNSAVLIAVRGKNQWETEAGPQIRGLSAF